MKLKDIILELSWKKVCDVFLQNYPNQKKNIVGFENVYKKLRVKPIAPSKMELFCEKNDPSCKEDEQFHDTYGVDGTKREDGTLEKFSLSLAPWSQWLGSSLSEKILKKYTKEEIVSHCLFDMTFYGFSEKEIGKTKKELDERIRDSNDQVRFIIVSNFLSKIKWNHYFNVSEETWCSDINSATFFKRQHYAESILKVLKKAGGKSNILAKISVKDKKCKILKYYR